MADDHIFLRWLPVAANTTTSKDAIRAVCHRLYGEHGAKLLAVMTAECRGRVDRAEDACQEAWLRLYQALRSDERLEDPFAWLVVVASRVHRDRMVAAYQSRRADLTAAAQVPSPGRTAEEAAAMAEALARLTERQYACVVLFGQGCRQWEIAEQTGLSRQQVQRALDSARTILDGTFTTLTEKKDASHD